MAKIIYLEDRIQKNLRRDCEKVLEEIEEYEKVCGLVHRACGGHFILQGVTPLFEIGQGNQITDLNDFCYAVDNSLIIEGWDVLDSIPLNENYFARRKKMMSNFGFPKIREKISEYRNTGELCVVFYGKDE